MRDVKKIIWPIQHEWKYLPEVRTKEVYCIVCSRRAHGVYYAPQGCGKIPNKIQPRCVNCKTQDEIYLLEEFYVARQ